MFFFSKWYWDLNFEEQVLRRAMGMLSRNKTSVWMSHYTLIKVIATSLCFREPEWCRRVPWTIEGIAYEQTHLWVVLASDKEQSNLAGRSLVKRCQESWPALISIFFSFLLCLSKVKGKDQIAKARSLGIRCVSLLDITPACCYEKDLQFSREIWAAKVDTSMQWK